MDFAHEPRRRRVRTTRRHARSRSLTRDGRSESTARAALLAWVVFVATLVALIATTHAQAPEQVLSHATFVVDSPGLPPAHLPAVPSPLVLRHVAPTPASVLLAPVGERPRPRAASARVLWLSIDSARAPDRVGIGGTWNLGGHRALVLDLTPSPRHCAPLVQVSF